VTNAQQRARSELKTTESKRKIRTKDLEVALEEETKLATVQDARDIWTTAVVFIEGLTYVKEEKENLLIKMHQLKGLRKQLETYENVPKLPDIDLLTAKRDILYTAELLRETLNLISRVKDKVQGKENEIQSLCDRKKELEQILGVCPTCEREF